MKISPVPSLANTPNTVPGASSGVNVRALKMSTNATPGRVEGAPAAELPIPDASIDPVKEVVEETQPLSPQLAAIAKQRRVLQQERQAFDREKAEQATRHSSFIDPAKFKSNPLGTMLDAGVTYEQLTAEILASNDGMTPELRALREEVKSLKENVDKTFADKETQAEKAALSEMEREANQLIAEGDTFELVRETKSIPHVMKLITRVYRETGDVLDVTEALQTIEDELIKDGLKLAASKKLQSQMTPAPVEQPPQQQRQMRTLTNRDTATVPMSRKARALAAWNNTLKR